MKDKKRMKKNHKWINQSFSELHNDAINIYYTENKPKKKLMDD